MSLETSESAFFSQPRLKCLFAIPHNPKFLLSNGDFKGALAFRLGIPLGVLQRVGDGAPPLRCLDSDDLWLAVVAAFTLRPQGLDWDSLRLSRTLSRLSRLSRAVPAVPPAALRLAPPRTQGPRRARAAVPAGIRPRDHCYASQRVSKLASLPIHLRVQTCDRSVDDRRPLLWLSEGAARDLVVLFLWCSAAALASYTRRRRIEPRASLVCAAVSRYCAHTGRSSRRVPCCPEPGLAISWLLVCAQFARSARHIRHSGPPHR